MISTNPWFPLTHCDELFTGYSDPTHEDDEVWEPSYTCYYAVPDRLVTNVIYEAASMRRGAEARTIGTLGEIGQDAGPQISLGIQSPDSTIRTMPNDEWVAFMNIMIYPIDDYWFTTEEEHYAWYSDTKWSWEDRKSSLRVASPVAKGMLTRFEPGPMTPGTSTTGLAAHWNAILKDWYLYYGTYDYCSNVYFSKPLSDLGWRIPQNPQDWKLLLKRLKNLLLPMPPDCLLNRGS